MQRLPIYIPDYVESDFKYKDLSEPTELGLLYILTNLVNEGEIIVEDTDIAYINTQFKDRQTNENIYLVCTINRIPNHQKWFGKKLCLKSELESTIDYYRKAQLAYQTSDEKVNNTYNEIYSSDTAKDYGYAATVIDSENRVKDPEMLTKVKKYDKNISGSLHRDGIAYNKMVAEKVVEMAGFPKPTKDELININMDGYKDGGIDFLFFECDGFMITNPYQLSKSIKSFKTVILHIGQSKFYSVFDINNIKDFLNAIDNFTEVEPINPFNGKMERRHELFTMILSKLDPNGTLLIKPYFASYGDNDTEANQAIYGNTVLMERNIKRKDPAGRLQLMPLNYITKSMFSDEESEEDEEVIA